jgi:hypothetical protein
MNTCQPHSGHSHTHGAGCGHKRVAHEGHEDYLHDGHLHHVHDGHVDEHSVADSADNPSACTPSHACGGHTADHSHGAGCGHDAVPHAGHVDYLVNGHLHHVHGGHCDDHGRLNVAG